MAKEKVHNLAKEFKVSSASMLQMLRSMGINVKSHMSTVDESMRDEIKKKFDDERAAIKKKYTRKQKIIEKSQGGILGRAKKAEEKSTSKGETRESARPKSNTGVQQKSGSLSDALKKETSRRKPREKSTEERVSHTKPADEEVKKEATRSTPAAEKTSQPTKKEGKEARGKKRKGKKGKGAPEVSQKDVESNVKKTMAKIQAGTSRKRYKKSGKKEEEASEPQNELLVSEFVTASEFAGMIGKPSSEIIAKCLELGLFVTINQRLDFETIELLAGEYGYNAKLREEYAPIDEDEDAEKAQQGELMPRAPVVTIMGHVDHGKTSLLDYIRKTNVIAGEVGNITQHIAAYEVQTKSGPVTFLDTPGHEAFTAMRARGSQITDVIVLIVAADSGVMPQTKEAIDHAKAASVPIVVAINKVDLETADVERVKGELAQHDVVVESYGGQVSSVEMSAKTGKNVDSLLETLALETELMELKASPEGTARGVVIESELDKGKGAVATVLVRQGTLHKGNALVVGEHYGRIRGLFDERGHAIDAVKPSQPALILGLSGIPQAGDTFRVMDDEKKAREISAKRQAAQREKEWRKHSTASLDTLYDQIQKGQTENLNVVIKGDVDGSVEALAESLAKLSTDEVKINVIHKSVGAIKESDIMLASASEALIIGYHISPNTKIKETAKRENVEIRTYRVIYDAIEDLRKAMEGMLSPEIREEKMASIQVREVFKISKVGKIAGCMVTSGTVRRGDKARLVRNDVEIAETKIESLKRHKDDTNEVKAGLECGIGLEKVKDIQPNDRIETYKEIEVARTLSA